MSDESKKGTTIAGLAIGGCIVTGIAGLITAVPVIISGNIIGGGILLVASALAFGLLSVGVLSR